MNDSTTTPQPARLYQHDFIACPACDKGEHRVDHLYGMTFPVKFGPWYCKECTTPFAGQVDRPGSVSVWPVQSRDRFTRSMALLKFDGVDGPVFFVMDHSRYHAPGTETDEENQSHQRYFFEEHSCPTNWLRECVAVIEGDDCDPHGFLTFVRAVDVPQDFDQHDDGNWSVLFPEAFSAPIIDASVSGDALLHQKVIESGN